MWFRLIFVTTWLFCLSSAKIDPEWLKPCFERYEDHKLMDAQPFHSEWKMADEADCLPFCAKSVSRCRSIVYDKLSKICHYFMVDGVELKKVVPQRNMAYFQLADANCAAKALEKEVPEPVPEEKDEQVEEESGPGNMPILFAPENFPQPPKEKVAASDNQKPRKNSKFDEKVDKMGPDETMIYPDDAELVGGVTDGENDDSESGKQEEQSQSEIRVAENEEKAPEEVSEGDGTIPPPPTEEEPTTPATEVESVAETVGETMPATETEAETTLAQVEETPTSTTEDPREVEMKKIRAEMEKLELEVSKIKELESQLQGQAAIFSVDPTVNPKLRLPSLPPNPVKIMEDLSNSMVPEMKGFKATKKELPSSIEEDIKASVDIRRHPGSGTNPQPVKSDIKSLAKAYVASLNDDVKKLLPEDESCPNDSNKIWIAIENSDLPRIGKFITKKANKPKECAEICNKLVVDDKLCNSFVFYETSKECSFGHEDEIFGVKPAKTEDFSTRAFKRLCFAESLAPFVNCGDFLAFRDYKLNVKPREVFDGLPAGRNGVSACVELCVLSSAFKCKSATFDFETGTCATFDQHSLSAPDAFKEHRSQTLLYFENGCNSEPVDGNHLGASVEKVEVSNKPLPMEPVILDYKTLKV